MDYKRLGGNRIPYKVKVDFNVLCASMEERIGSKISSSNIITTKLAKWIEELHVLVVRTVSTTHLLPTRLMLGQGGIRVQVPF